MQMVLNCFNDVESILKRAYKENRLSLYEFEIYEILKKNGIDTPRYTVIRNPNEMDEKTLEPFGKKFVVKIISKDIIHKSKIGGVKIIENPSVLFLKFVMAEMKKEVINAHNTEIDIYGFLIVEFIPHTNALGYEILIGFKEDSECGPVVTLSKGGDDAEFFAKYYNKANLFMPPLEEDYIHNHICNIKIRHKYESIGHLEYMRLISRTTGILSKIAYMFSFISPKKPTYILESLEINPFAITKDGRFVAIDGYANFYKSTDRNSIVATEDTNNLEAFFEPKGVAVYGVSTNLEKHSLGREIIKLLEDIGRKDIYIVHPNGGELKLKDNNYPLYKSLDEIDSQVDLVVFAAPAKYSLGFFEQINKNIPKAVILISGIPSDMDYSQFKEKINNLNKSNIRIIGPNCMGIFHAPSQNLPGVDTLFIEEERLDINYDNQSNAVILSQSGGLAITTLDKLKKCALFRDVVSFGNKLDVNFIDLIRYFSKDNNIDVISLYIEGLENGEGRRFFEICSEIDKPIIAYKSGKTEAGAKQAMSHTASMSGNYEVFKAVCEQSDIILSESIDDFYDDVKTFSLLSKKLPKGNRVAGIVNAGFESAIGADELSTLVEAKYSEATTLKLKKTNDYGLVNVDSAFLDLTPMADDQKFADFVEVVLQDPNTDCVIVGFVPHVVSLKATPQNCRDKDSIATLLIDLFNRYNKPIVFSVNAGTYYQEVVDYLEENKLPVFDNIRSAIKALDRFANYHFSKNQQCKKD